MRVRIEHTTRFRYSQPARSSFNEVRLAPRSDEHQNLLSFVLQVRPAVRATSYRDHFGTLVHAFNLLPAHEHLEIASRSTVVTYPRRVPPDDVGDLAALEDPRLRDERSEWLQSSALAAGGDHLYAFAQHVRRVVRATSVLGLLRGVSAEVHRRFTYVQGTSYVSSTVDDLLERGTGVCQDFAHLTIATLRDLGVPSRYVSGYFYAGGPGEPELDMPLAVESHAWVEGLVPGHGWVQVDPTNDCLADERHVLVAIGRDYADVAPLRGVLQGGGGQTMEVSVTMTAPSADVGQGVAVPGESGPSLSGQGRRRPAPVGPAVRRLAVVSAAAGEVAQQHDLDPLDQQQQQ